MNICALATGRGGAIAIVRLSGPDVIAIADRIFRPASDKPLTAAKGHTLHFGTILSVPPTEVAGQEPTASAEGLAGSVLDEALVSVFRAPHSYTGEDAVEFSLHASPYIINEVLRLLCANGCRMAGPGEFTQRAFLGGKLDLSQAEAVADLIACRTRAQHDMALSQLRGSFSRQIDVLHDRLLHLTTLMELELDFSDHEDLEFADRTELHALCDEILTTVTRLADSYATGNAIKEGVRVAIVGPTNAGKSTLLNAILHEERAIVSDIHGTTRDTIEDVFVWQGITFRFIDTAGLRTTDDKIEQIGIARSRQAIRDAHIILYLSDDIEQLKRLGEHADPSVTDASHQNDNLPAADLSVVEGSQPNANVLEAALSRTIRVLTKTDQQPTPLAASTSLLPIADKPDAGLDHSQQRVCDFILPISAKTGAGLDHLQQCVCNIARDVLHIDSTDLVVSNQRHHAALVAASESLQRVRTALHEGLPTDLVTQDLRDALHHLATITHREITPDTILDNVFKNFCIGK